MRSAANSSLFVNSDGEDIKTVRFSQDERASIIGNALCRSLLPNAYSISV